VNQLEYEQRKQQLQQELNSFTRRYNTAQSNLSAAQTNINRLNSEIANCQSNICTCSNDISAKRTGIANHEELSRKVIGAEKEFHANIQEQKDKLAKMFYFTAHVRSAKFYHEKMSELLTGGEHSKAVSGIDQAKKGVKSKLTALNRDLDDLVSRKNTLDQQLTNMNGEKNGYQQSLANATGDRDNCQREINRINQELRTLESRKP
jgi:chromosome segregation ATPase